MRALGILVVLVLLSGCSGAATDRGDGAPTPADGTSATAPATVLDAAPTTATPAWSTRLDVLQAPVAAGDVLVVAVAARGDEIDVVALDREDGAILWRRPLMVVGASIGAYLGDLVHESADGETYVVMQQARTGRALRPEAALPYLALDPRTGKVLARTRPVVAQFGAPACDDGLDVCLRISQDDRFEETRWVLGSWRLRPEKERLPAGTNALVAGSDVYTVDGPVRQYAVAKAVGRVGRSSWRVPHGRITGSRRWLVDDQTGFVDDEAGVAVVQLLPTTEDAVVRRYQRGAVVRFDLAQRRTAGLDLETGKVLWRHRGADIRCLELTRTELPVRCAFSGQRSYQQDRDPRLVSARGWLEGYDPRTGETTWRQELGVHAVRTLVLDILRMDARGDRVVDADDVAVIPTADGPKLLSLVDGSALPLAAREPVVCSVTVPFRHRFDTDGTGVVLGFRETRERRFVEPCPATGKALDRSAMDRLGAAALLTGAVDARDGMRVLASRHAVHAYRLAS
ncbi:PQQ-binding-like beta-propeller repeat protein [Microbacterium sp. ARD31]|uniref:outer membrane protein assembly factor BamB family protein n=1 Tax=Microbacterium sp. ARD31 TaxID=2962576 RepID=UPI00288240AD|nr:PQQ-binding-like beta-propeller repeat protein [Microbacterium sp. ARD31]MDT0185314.1 PQQ-binding-like beta-propeller repeat protein [Microbacterium sp. ARD31]